MQLLSRLHYSFFLLLGFLSPLTEETRTEQAERLNKSIEFNAPVWHTSYSQSVLPEGADALKAAEAPKNAAATQRPEDEQEEE